MYNPIICLVCTKIAKHPGKFYPQDVESTCLAMNTKNT
jgi:hypothetical protein